MNENKILAQKAMLGDLDGVQLCLNRGANATAYNNTPLRNSILGEHIQITKLLLRRGASCSVAFDYAIADNNIELLDFVMFDAELIKSGRNVASIFEAHFSSIWTVIKNKNSLKTLQYLLPKLNPREIENNRIPMLVVAFQPNNYQKIETQNAYFLIDYLMPTDAELEMVVKHYKTNTDINPLMDYVIVSRERAQLSGIDGSSSNRKFKL